MPEIPPPQFVDYFGVELQLHDRVVVCRGGSGSSTKLDVGTIEKFHPKSDKVTIQLEGEPEYRWESRKFVVNNGKRKFVKI